MSDKVVCLYDFYLFFASLDNRYFDVIEGIIDNLDLKIGIGGLLSYLDNRSVLNDLVEFRQSFGDEFKIMLDSGAFTFVLVYRKMINGEKIESRRHRMIEELIRKNRIDEYLEDYVSYVNGCDVWDFYVELDIQPIVGVERVLEWRDVWKDSGLEPFLVYHGEDDEYLRGMCRDSSKIGIGGDIVDSSVYEDKVSGRVRKVSVCRKVRNMRDDAWIPWFAISDVKFVPNLIGMGLVNSVDMTTWLGNRFGRTHIVENGRLEKLEVKRNAKSVVLERYWKYIEENKSELCDIGIDLQKLYEMHHLGINALSIYSFVKFFDGVFRKRSKRKQVLLSEWFR
jgi:hypothetical protein